MRFDYDVIVVGAGHAGVEAASASAKMGAKTLLLTIKLESIGRMSCNPTIGGPAKGHITREIDALGGLQGKVTDETGIQFRTLNKKKGPAVWAPRSQNDRNLYSQIMREYLEKNTCLEIMEAEVDSIIVDYSIMSVKGVQTQLGSKIYAPKIILANGTFLKGLIHIGKKKFSAGRAGEPSAEMLSGSLKELGFNLGRFKTGTPPRIDIRSVDFTKVDEQPGDEPPEGFSFFRDVKIENKVSCYLGYTNNETHRIIRENINKSSLYSGQINARGPRYCPSIEDKIVRFADKEQHHIFIEPEGLNTFEAYVNGISNSFPPEVQDILVRSISGLEKAKIMRYGYAIEYDYVIPNQINQSMETKTVKGLYFAGQINGTSGYEEAAGQGITAGVNAVLSLDKKDSFIPERSNSYIGVLIDDLITKGTKEPYRMFTSRAEFRLHLRQDNADERLMPLGFKLGLVSDTRWNRFQAEQEMIKKVTNYLNTCNGFLQNATREPIKFANILKRPDISFDDLTKYGYNYPEEISQAVKNKLSLQIKYEGYLKRQIADIEKFEVMEHSGLPSDLDYLNIKTISLEAREKLNEIKPVSLGQAARISGVNFTDITAIMVYLKKNRIEFKR